MASGDREYMREEFRRRKAPPMPPFTKWLLILNIGIFLLDFFQRSRYVPVGPINQWGAFSFDTAIGQLHIWEFITFQFLHHNFGHLLFNCIAMYFFAPFVERSMGGRKFIAYYLICGVGGALLLSLLLLPTGEIATTTTATPMVGASAGLFGLFFAVYKLAPAMKVHLLIPPVTLTMKQFAMFLGGFAVFMIIGGVLYPGSPFFWNTGGEIGHLGGALMGLLLMKFPGLLSWAGGEKAKIIRPKQFRRKSRFGAKVRPRTTIDLNESDEVDRILEKIQEHGIESLTAKERETLKQASER